MFDEKDLKTEAFDAYPERMSSHSLTGVRLTHLPTGKTVKCAENRSYHKNRLAALEKLQVELKDETDV